MCCFEGLFHDVDVNVSNGHDNQTFFMIIDIIKNKICTYRHCNFVNEYESYFQYHKKVMLVYFPHFFTIVQCCDYFLSLAVKALISVHLPESFRTILPPIYFCPVLSVTR